MKTLSETEQDVLLGLIQTGSPVALVHAFRAYREAVKELLRSRHADGELDCISIVQFCESIDNVMREYFEPDFLLG